MIDISIREWCEEVYNSSREGSWEESENITLDVARADLANFRRCGWDLPLGITPKKYMEAMNELNAEQLRRAAERARMDDYINVRVWCALLYDQIRAGSAANNDDVTVDVARADLDRFRQDGWDLPSGITPELYAEAMNDIADEESENDV